MSEGERVGVSEGRSVGVRVIKVRVKELILKRRGSVERTLVMLWRYKGVKEV